MNSMLLVVASSAGQNPAGGYQLPKGYTPLPTAAQQGALVAPAEPRWTAAKPTPVPTENQPAPAPTAQPAPMTPAPAPTANCNGNGCNPWEEKKEEEPPEPWALMRCLKGTCFGNRLDECGITIMGWTEGNYTLGNRGASNLPITFNDRGDFWQMNQNFLRIDKSVDPKKKEF